jgi:hypothetical protein
MHGNTDFLDRLQQTHLAGLATRQPGPTDKGQEDSEEGACAAFGFLRGLHDRAAMVEFRFRNGNAHAFPYSWLGPVQFNPSAGLLLKFTGDVVTLVLIRGSNLDLPVNGAVNLTDRGIQRHRVTFVREMDEGEVRVVGERGPTIDAIVIAEFEAQEDLLKWVDQTAPAFARRAAGG